MTTSVDELFIEITNERGGVDALSAVQLSLARSLAIAVSEEPVNAATVSALTALLPAPTVKQPSEAPWDLSLLSDSQTNVLQMLYDIAHGLKPAVPEHRQKSDRHWAAIDLARKLDALIVDERIGYADDQLTSEDRIEIAGLIEDLVRPLHLPVLLEPTLRGAWNVSTWVPPAPIPAVENNAPAAVPESRLPAATNVVPLARGNGSAALRR